jgi:hypothetical protein
VGQGDEPRSLRSGSEVGHRLQQAEAELREQARGGGDDAETSMRRFAEKVLPVVQKDF